jgi:hypothetical protein
MLREAVGVFEDPEELDAAVAELENTAFPRDSISVLGPASALKKKFGVPYVRPEDAEDNPDAPRDILVRPEEKIILLSAAAAIGVYGLITGAGLVLASVQDTVDITTMLLLGIVAAIGAFLATTVVLTRQKKQQQRQIEAGGMVLWVRTPAPEQENVAREILSKHGARDVHIHLIN